VVSTDSAGAFRLEGLSSGAASVLVRRLGYRPRTFAVAVEEGTRYWLDVVLTPRARELGGMRVQAKVDANGALREFQEHRGRAQFGYFLDSSEVTKRRPLYPSDLLRPIPGVRLVRASGIIGSQVWMRGCRPLLWINGLRVADGEFDDTVTSDDIAALEVYTSFAGIPAQYVDRETNCGAIVVWTRS
jgi:hypothetical protein